MTKNVKLNTTSIAKRRPGAISYIRPSVTTVDISRYVLVLGGFKLKNAYYRAALNFANLKCQVYYQIVLSNINTS